MGYNSVSTLNSRYCRLPEQMLSTRGRKDVDAKDVKVKVIVEAFDILYLNGKVKNLFSLYVIRIAMTYK